MEQPDAGQDDPSGRDLPHHDKTDRHQYCHHGHDPDLRLPCHAFAFYIAFQVILVEFGANEPAMQALRAPGKAICRHEQERERGKQGQDCAHRTKGKADAAQDHK